MRYSIVLIILSLCAFIVNTGFVQAQNGTIITADMQRTALKKQLYIPGKVYRIPENNDYDSAESDYSFKRMRAGENIVIFWHKEYGHDPTAYPDAKKRFNPKEALEELERFYQYYVNELKLVQKGSSLTDKYKMILYVLSGNEGTAFGGGTENKVGMLWTPPGRMNKMPYGTLAHELGHSFQYIMRADAGNGLGGPVNEMAAQYLLWQVYPDWMTFENYHLVDFLKKTHYAFLHPTNMYHSPYVLEYWSQKHGVEFYGNLSRATQKGEDAVITYKRLTGLDQEAFNEEMFDACRRFVTWDLKRIEEVAKPYANRHSTKMDAIGKGWFQIAKTNVPQNYGYNGIKLKVPKAGTTITLQFKGISASDSFHFVNPEKAGWRYGFVAYKKDSSRTYSPVYKTRDGKATFNVPENTAYLWLVVMGAPTEHWSLPFGRQKTETSNTEEAWPYQVKLRGTAPDHSVINE
ncbi:hypothetical protein HRG84_23770 [Flavisolibacter sp. BT320]|nr:hypothetical protein [Flavisolibacter longurius]